MHYCQGLLEICLSKNLQGHNPAVVACQERLDQPSRLIGRIVRQRTVIPAGRIDTVPVDHLRASKVTPHQFPHRPPVALQVTNIEDDADVQTP